MFKTTTANGFHITFANDHTVSVQWNPGNYVSDRTGNYGDKRESVNAEVAAWDNVTGDCVNLGSGDDVAGWQTPEQVAAIIANIAALPATVSEVLMIEGPEA